LFSSSGRHELLGGEIKKLVLELDEIIERFDNEWFLDKKLGKSLHDFIEQIYLKGIKAGKEEAIEEMRKTLMKIPFGWRDNLNGKDEEYISKSDILDKLTK